MSLGAYESALSDLDLAYNQMVFVFIIITKEIIMMIIMIIIIIIVITINDKFGSRRSRSGRRFV